MWTDNETSLDLLGFRVHADLIRSVVTDPNLLPVTIGVFADWGGGKTSLMKMLQESFDPENGDEGSVESEECNGIACLYFNGWLFEGYDDAKSAILSSVLMALEEHKRFGPQVRDGCASLLKSVNWMRVAHLGLKHVALPAMAAYMTGGVSAIPSLITSAGKLLPKPKEGADEPDASSDSSDPASPSSSEESSNGGTQGIELPDNLLNERDQMNSGPLDVRTFREKFAKLLEESDIKSLVVLIDDLDRCTPERIIENLEAIKLFLNVENTAFIIGADPRIVRNAIAWKYKDHDDSIENESPTIVTDYLEKLIQCPYHLPRLSPAEIETYMALLFCQSYLNEEQFHLVVAACNKQRSENRYMVFGYADVQAAVNSNGNSSLPDELVNALVFSAAAAPLITEGLKGNPRQVKRFLNAFVLRKKLADVAKLTNIQDDILVKLMILEYSHEKHFRQLFEWQATQNGIAQELSELEKGLPHDETAGVKKDTRFDDWQRPPLKRWIKMEPSLSGIDLRDYFWITRDRLQSSMSGMSMVPPLVRQVFEDLISDNASKISQAAISANEFDDSERETLFGLLQRNVKQNPSVKCGYDGYRALIEKGVSEAPRQFATAIGEAPAAEIPPAVGGDVLLLIKQSPDCEPVFHDVIESLQKTDTHVGRMIEQLGQLGK